ncbi:mannose-binding protein [Streptomyces sp. NPDC014623]|uniref:mannose-binding protein n=1 Tax=Streptomyces sp. NPDC014623 TaxID=3364875 RepID=UPI0037006774
MSSQHPVPGANAAAAASDVQEAGASSPSPAPAEETPDPAAASPGTEPGTAPAGTAVPAPAPPSAAAETTAVPRRSIGVATTAETAPGTTTGTGTDGGRPRTPLLAGAAFVGAALVAIPLLLVGSANDRGQDETAMRPAAEGADTVLNPNSAPAALGDYVAGKPSPSPSKEGPKKSDPPKAAVPEPAPEPRTSSPAAKKPEATPKATPKPKPKPEAAPKPDWTTVTFSAPSVLAVNQAWTNNRIRLVMQTDGNLVLHNEHGKPIWASMTFGENHRAIFQPDGNLVVHNGADRAIWATRTHDYAGAQLVLRADAKVAIVHNGRVVWST